jgi:uncharacterized Ntn-hydrolase superfamily protein
MTYSIVARDPATGQLGVAVQSFAFMTGPVVAWAEAGVGAVATQAFVEVSYGPRLLAALRDGAGAPDALANLTGDDAMQAMHQVGVVDAYGRAAAHTGASTVPETGHRVGDGYSVQANTMLRATVPDAMATAFERSSGDLSLRLLEALDAAEAEGGDLRGRMSGRILVVEGERADAPGHGVVLDIGIEAHAYPLDELRRLRRLGEAHRHLEAAIDALQQGDPNAVLDHIDRIGPELGHVVERPLVHAAALLFLDRMDDARSVIARYEGDPSVPRLYAQRLRAAGIMPLEDATFDSLFGA